MRRRSLKVYFLKPKAWSRLLDVEISVVVNELISEGKCHASRCLDVTLRNLRSQALLLALCKRQTLVWCQEGLRGTRLTMCWTWLRDVILCRRARKRRKGWSWLHCNSWMDQRILNHILHHLPVCCRGVRHIYTATGSAWRLRHLRWLWWLSWCYCFCPSYCTTCPCHRWVLFCCCFSLFTHYKTKHVILTLCDYHSYANSKNVVLVKHLMGGYS